MVPGTAGFCNALDDLPPCASCGCTGICTPSDYTAQGLRADGSAWQCRVVPTRWAMRKGEQDKFHPAQSLARCIAGAGPPLSKT
jgi:hypothetical protein